ncbi:hypothetical protein LSH36_10g06030 [Paralvinella palmiformis]|uniref:Alpha-2-macroglobulin bait region domain-containing protein n=1 Tax=Paralvinella palmiformis TaxID=53620 RepID=A0AAD9NI53_9ANNE|nr:hypothetical protein LSH36_10g06030 [Paralvinella palmiformis]
MHLDLGITLIVSITWMVVSAKRGIIVTAPDTWLLGSEEKVCVAFHNIDFDVVVEAKVTLSDDEADTGSNTETHTFNGGQDGCFPMVLSGSYTRGSSKLHVHAQGTAADGKPYKFNQTRLISVRDTATKANITFIETDKGIYKPGDKVQIRILTIMENLRPCKEMIPLVTVQNPAGLRIMQWRDVDVSQHQGLGNLSFDLSTEPSLGTWKITVERADGHKESQTFTVDKYVLPKFEVQVKPQSFIPVWGQTVHAQICARYTYGQPVKGNLTVTTCLRKEYGHISQIPCFEKTVQMESCYNITYPLKDVLDKIHSVYGNIYITINATVVEEGTGSVVSKFEETTRLGFKKYKIEFVDMPQYFRPGMTFRGKVHIIDNTGSSVEGLEVAVSVGNTAQEVHPYILHTDSTGTVNFTFSGLELAKNSDYFLVRAHLQKKEDFGRFSHVIQEPQIMKTVSIWYSPSKSAIQINKLPDASNCGSNISVKVSLSGNEFRRHSFFRLLVVQDRIVQHGKVDNKEMLRREADHMSFVLRLPLSIWGKASLIVYTVTGEDEVVADMHTFEIKQCYDNNVTMEFNQPIYAPGDDVILSLTAGPGSLCGYGVADKSVLLLGGGNTVAMDAITNQIPRKSSVRPFGYMDEYCERKQEDDDDVDPLLVFRKKKKNRRRPRMIIPFPGGHWTSRFVDSSRAFQRAHVIVLSDLSVDTRPCDRRRWPVYRAFYSTVTLKRKSSGGRMLERKTIKHITVPTNHRHGLRLKNSHSKHHIILIDDVLIGCSCYWLCGV